MADFKDRALATVRRVDKVEPIAGADRVEVAWIGGWRCVVGKGSFKAGDLGSYFEIDAFLPASDSRYAMLSDKFEEGPGGVLGARIKTRKLMGKVSQGLLLPLSDFPELEGKQADYDATQDLGIIKWDEELPSELMGVAKGYLPGRIRRTKQERIQNEPDWFADGQEWEASQKLDGESMTIYLMEGAMGVCTHAVDLLESEGNMFWQAAKDSKILEALEKLGGEWAVQGELVGPGIKGNRDKLAKKEFVVFGVQDLDKQLPLPPAKRREFMKKLASLGSVARQVPVVRTEVLSRVFAGVDEIVAASDGKSAWSDSKREGLVWERVSDAQSFKVISNAYLLGEDTPKKSKAPKM